MLTFIRCRDGAVARRIGLCRWRPRLFAHARPPTRYINFVQTNTLKEDEVGSRWAEGVLAGQFERGGDIARNATAGCHSG